MLPILYVISSDYFNPIVSCMSIGNSQTDTIDYYSNSTQSVTTYNSNQLGYVLGNSVDSALIKDTSNIQFDLFDYDANTINVLNGSYRNFTFSKSNTGKAWNNWTGNSNSYQGILKNSLGSDGFPVLRVGNRSSLNYLFDKDTSGVTNAYFGVSGLFVDGSQCNDVTISQNSSYDGYYYFSSRKYSATLDTKTNSFNLYHYRKSPNNSGYSNIGWLYDKNSTYSSKFLNGDGDTPFGDGFYPFNNDFSQVINSTNSLDYHFGSHMKYSFIQAKDGTINDKDTIFYFSGDDDLWVYIDGTLVLDLGGIHDATSGYIDLKDGTITYSSGNANSKYSAKTKLSDIFKSDVINRQGTFYDYSQHTLEVFYFERGASASNLELLFNTVPVPDNSIMVGKKLSYLDEDSKPLIGGYTDYTFKLYVYNQDGIADVLRNTQYDIYSLDTFEKVGCGTTNSDGEFTITANQYAVFSESEYSSSDYYVQEVYVDPTEYSSVSCDTLYYDDGYQENVNVTKTSTDVWQSDRVSSNSGILIFNNVPTTENYQSIDITKLGKDLNNVQMDYSYKVKLEFLVGDTWLPYSDSYTIGDTEYSATNGTISLRVGQTATVSGIPCNTVFRTTEVDKGSTTLIETTINGDKVQSIDSQSIGLGKDYSITYLNANTLEYILPSTGTECTAIAYTVGGTILLTLSNYILVRKFKPLH